MNFMKRLNAARKRAFSDDNKGETLFDFIKKIFSAGKVALTGEEQENILNDIQGGHAGELARAIFGADSIDSGEFYVQGKKVPIRSPGDAVRYGIGYLSEDRKRYGLTLGMDVETNIVLATFRKFLGYLGWVNAALTRTTAAHFAQCLSAS